MILEHFQFREDTSQDGESGDGAFRRGWSALHALEVEEEGEANSLGHTNKEQKSPKRHLGLIHKPIINPHAYRRSQRKRHHHPHETNTARSTKVSFEDFEICIHADYEEEEAQAEVGD